jgi:NTP pyrophosphatase (non-canonical NTP hydrolase)|nr:MAG TPA: nucleoside triphosphate pyrophosphohydrolase [Caudoviricetes sp.]DAU94965.1 MAG TPA: nucleoside triphosphate pyrophosphohydrolase [Caudoviricetes sp.]DAW05009.1 MAG TPA: nucleoside triphosphate pyrophosphohydrolase [Caudoviricetes sp.]DAW43806.1 MAG TPA: nucleoside triphosphate pyrophosphohydrolase [Caudoviricetes sp.]
MAEYVKKSDVIKIMENNSYMIEVFGVKKKMIDGFAMGCDFADLKIVEIDDEEEINMKPEEAKDILSDMRDQHLCFLESSENKDEWQKKYLKEAWACDSGAKALAGLITGIKINKGVIAESILHYGKNNQSTVCMEECAELIQAISKAKRGKINRDNMIEEIADVLICIEMLKQMYMISDEKINKWIEKKQAREAERMKKNE